MPVRKRSQARMLALQALCLFDAIGDEFAERLDEFLRDPQTHADLAFEAPPPPRVLSFARGLALEAWHNRRKHDGLLARHVPHWTVSRMPPVDRNILRLGVHELCERDPHRPPNVVINEAVELAHRFADADSPAFVNGVLDAIRRNMDSAESCANAPDPAEQHDAANDD